MRSIRWVFVLAACGVPEPEPVVTLGGIQTQDRHLLGEWIDKHPIIAAKDTFLRWVNGTATYGEQAIAVGVTGTAALRSGGHAGADPYFNQVVLDGPNAKTRLTVLGGDAELAFYRVEVARAETDMHEADPRYIEECDGAPAIPLAGRWTATGEHVLGNKPFISFACEGSAAYKCVMWGYAPGTDPDSWAWKKHEACTRMARADYCGNGVPHTYEGTSITIYDPSEGVVPAFDTVESWPPDNRQYYFEAAWGAGGAVCLDRMRWSGLPMGERCTQPPPPCDVVPSDGVMFVNTSRYDDLELQLWSSGTELVSTVSGTIEQPPLAGYTWMGSGALVLRTPPPPGKATLFDKLAMFRRGHDHVVAISGHGPEGFRELSYEGYIWKAPPPKGSSVPLRLYRRPPPQEDWVSTTRPDDLPDDYQEVETLGYLRPARQATTQPTP